MPTPSPLRPGRRLHLSELVVADGLAGPLEAPRERGAVPDQPGGRPVGELVVADEVSPADVSRVHAEPAGGHVEEALHREHRGGPADPPVGARRRLRRRRRPYPAAVFGHPVGSGEEGRDLHRLDRGRPRIDRVGARVADDLGPQAEDRPVFVDPELRPDHLVERLGGRHEVFAPVARPLDGAPEPAREDRDQHLLAVQGHLPPEAAAHVGRHHPEAAAGQVEHLREHIPDDPRDLGARVQGEDAPAFVVLREVAAVLDRGGGLAAHPEAARDPHRRPCDRRVGVSAHEFPVDDYVAQEVLVEARRAGRDRRLRVRLGGERLVVDHHLLRRVLGEVAVVGEHRRHRLAGVADPGSGEHRQLRCLVARHAGGGPKGAEGPLDVGGGHHRGDAGRAGRLRGVDAGDAGVALVAPAEREVQRAGAPEVVHVAPAPGEEARILDPLHARADEAGPDFDGDVHSKVPVPAPALPPPAAAGPPASPLGDDPAPVSGTVAATVVAASVGATAAVAAVAAARTARTMCS